MSPSDRRQAMLEYLCEVRHSTCLNLSRQFGVCERTIRNDIQILMSSYPLETAKGRYGGGVYLPDWFQRYGRKKLSVVQSECLKKIRNEKSGREREILDSILIQFT